MKNKVYQAVCFDLDGVLIDSMPLHAQAWQMAGKSFGLRVSKRFIYAHKGEQGSKSACILFAKKSKNSLSSVLQLLQAKEEHFRKLASRIKTHAELVESLTWLKKHKIPMALVTGTSWGEVRRVVSKRILSHFETIITGDRIRHGKPNPEPYQTAFRSLAISPSQAIVIENAPYGIRSARRADAGLVLAFASSLPKSYLHEAHWVGSSAHRVAEHLKDVIMAGLSKKEK